MGYLEFMREIRNLCKPLVRRPRNREEDFCSFYGQVADFCKLSKEPPGSIKGIEFLD
jgi:hypothetical protein